MESDGKAKKRPLPAWMTAVSSQSKASKVDTANSCQSSSATFVPETKTVVQDKANGTSIKNERNSAGVKPGINEPEKLSAADIIAQSMPFLTFPGSIVYSYYDSDCSLICEDIKATLCETEKTPVGFDMEWPVSYQKGAKDKTSLIQMCVTDSCYLFHISAMSSLPKRLAALILDPAIILVGLNIENDLWKLARDFDINVKPIFDRKAVIDVGKLANEKLKSSERWSLEGLCRNLLCKRLDKDASVRCGDWSEFPLQREQKLYAAADAYAGLLLYQKLTETHERP